MMSKDILHDSFIDELDDIFDGDIDYIDSATHLSASDLGFDPRQSSFNPDSQF